MTKYTDGETVETDRGIIQLPDMVEWEKVVADLLVLEGRLAENQRMQMEILGIPQKPISKNLDLEVSNEHNLESHSYIRNID